MTRAYTPQVPVTLPFEGGCNSMRSADTPQQRPRVNRADFVRIPPDRQTLWNKAAAFTWVILACNSVWFVTGCDKPNETSSAETAAGAEEAPTPYLQLDPTLATSGRIATAEVKAFAYAGAQVVPGEITPAPEGEAEVGSLVAGRVASLERVEGATVKKGDVLAWIDSPEIGAIRADLVRADAQVSAANKRLERQVALHNQMATSQGALDDARAAVQTAEADRQAARAKLSSVGAGGAGVSGRIPIRSPIDGIITERKATLGGAVAPDTTLFRVVNLSTLRVRAQWSETLGAIPAVGTGVRLSPRQGLTAGAMTCDGAVESHLGTIAAATRSVTVQIVPSETCPPFTPGAYIDVVIDGPQRGADATDNWTQVPIEAVVDLRGVPTVFVAASASGRFEPRRVLPRPTLGGVVPIEAGLSPGERVAVKGVILLKGEALRDILGGD